MGYVEPYQVASIVIMNKTYARNRFCCQNICPIIGYFDHRSKVILFCQSVKPGVFQTNKKITKLNKRLFEAIMEKVIFGTAVKIVHSVLLPARGVVNYYPQVYKLQ